MLPIDTVNRHLHQILEYSKLKTFKTSQENALDVYSLFLLLSNQTIKGDSLLNTILLGYVVVVVVIVVAPLNVASMQLVQVCSNCLKLKNQMSCWSACPLS